MVVRYYEFVSNEKSMSKMKGKKKVGLFFEIKLCVAYNASNGIQIYIRWKMNQKYSTKINGAHHNISVLPKSQLLLARL